MTLFFVLAEAVCASVWLCAQRGAGGGGILMRVLKRRDPSWLGDQSPPSPLFKAALSHLSYKIAPQLLDPSLLCYCPTPKTDFWAKIKRSGQDHFFSEFSVKCEYVCYILKYARNLLFMSCFSLIPKYANVQFGAFSCCMTGAAESICGGGDGGGGG